MKTSSQRKNSKVGITLFSVMVGIGGLSIIAAMAFNYTRTDFTIAANHTYQAEAFAQADAGTQYAKSRIEAQLAANTITFTNPNITSISVNYPAPSGYNFDTITNIFRASNGSYYFTVIGRATNNARASITSSWKQRSAVSVGAFGYKAIDIKASGYVYSYYSGQLSGLPTAADSTGDADAASDILFTTHVGTSIDGDLILGAASEGGTAATWTDPGGGAIISGYEGQQVGYINPDPLGLLTSPLGTAGVAMASASTNNNNSIIANSYFTQSGTTLSLGNGNVLTLTPGNYYFGNLIVKGGATLNLNATGNEKINIYVTGNVDIQNNSIVNLTGEPPNVALFCNNTANNASVVIYNSGAFQGMVYAPGAYVEIKNSGNFYGVAWGESVDIKNSGSFFIDLSLIQQYMLPKISLVSWKQDR